MQTVMYASPLKYDRCIGICCTGLDPALMKDKPTSLSVSLYDQAFESVLSDSKIIFYITRSKI